MLEALMIVTMMSGQVVQTKMPDFTECLKNVSVVELQKSVKYAACIPKGVEAEASEKIWSFGDIILRMVDRHADYCEENPFKCEFNNERQ